MPGKNIFGESFKPYVADQINTRQNKLAITNQYDPETLKFINNNAPWIRLSSGVNVSPDRAKTLDANLSGAELAKQYTLFSARSSKNSKDNNFTSGIGYSLSSTSYGFLSDPVYGLVPPPGIISAEIKPMNDKGTLRIANIQIECHNLPQFRVIEALYLRLKYSMLLEWGHTVFFDNNGKLQNAGNQDWVYQGFLNGSHNQDTLITALENARVQSSGNYDGFFGWVRNFNWDLKPNGGYNINLELISLGDPIESLKLNVNYPQASAETAAPAAATAPSTPQPPVIANKNKSTIHQILFALKSELDNLVYMDGHNVGGRSSLQGTDVIRWTKERSQYDLQGVNYLHPDEKWDTANHILTYQEGVKMLFPKLASQESGANGYFYYIKLGALLRIIESFLLKYDTSRGAPGSYLPMFYIDHNYDNNLCLTLPRQISTDPRICILPSSTPPTSDASSPDQAKVTTVYNKISFQLKEEEVGASLDNWFGNNNFYLEQSATEAVNGDDTSFKENQVITQFETITQEQTDANGQTATRVTGVKVIYKNGNPKTFYYSDGAIGPFFVDSTNLDKNNKVLDKDEATGEITIKENANNTSGLGNYFRVGGDEYAFLGKFLHIHVNLDFIASVLSDNIDEDGKISIYVFLEQLMQGIQDATGNINDYRIMYDELSNTFYIVDNTTLPNADKYFNTPSIKPTMINAHVLKNTIGSFVTNVSIKSELNNNYATMISVGAQSNGNVVGEDATAFSKWNEGYTDRIITDRNSVVDLNTESQSGSKSPDQVYLDNLVKYGELNNSINNGYITTEDITNNGQAVVDMLKYEIAYFTQNNCMQGQGFLPINLQLTMLGLSGPRLFETYTIDETLLPDNYKDNIKFLAKGITHKIDSSGWITTLDSLMAPKADSLNKPTFFVPPIPKKSNPSAKSSTESTGGGGGGGGGGNASDISGCDKLPGVLDEEIVTSKIVPNAYGGYIKGKKSFIAKIEGAYQSLVTETNKVPINIGDSLRDFAFQKKEHERWLRGERKDKVAEPCKGYHVRGQAIDLNQTSAQKKDIQAHGAIYTALYNAGLRRISSEWWHWSLGETDHPFDKKFTDHGGDTI